MSLPRRVLPGATYLVSRRCTQRQFLLSPSDVVRDVFWYSLAYAAGVYGLEVHAVVVMSNHWHGVVTDPRGDLPRCMQLFHSLVAKALNLHYLRAESFWAPGSYSSVEITDEATLIDKLCYTWANPVRAGLVREPAEWPGEITSPEDMGSRVIEARRPSFFFRRQADERDSEADTARARAQRRARRRDVLPERIQLRLTVPQLLRETDPGQLRADLRRILAERLREIHQSRRDLRLGYLGATAVMAQCKFATPWGSVIPDGSLNPRLACRGHRRGGEIEGLVAFWEEHRAAFEAFRAGKRRVLFPPGSYNARVLMGARVRATSPPPAQAA